MRSPTVLVLLVLLGASAGCYATVSPMRGGIVVRSAPPPAPRVVVPAPPYAGAVWIDGHWEWSGSGYVWVDGYWVEPRPGHVIVQPRWERRPGGYVYVGGGWRDHRGVIVAPPPPRPVGPPRRGVIVTPPRRGVIVTPPHPHPRRPR